MTDTSNPDGLREAVENLVSVCDDLEKPRADRCYGGGRMSGYWLQRDRIDALRAALATSTPGDAPEGPTVAQIALILCPGYAPVRELPDRQPDVNGAPDGKPSPCPFCGGDPYVVEPQYRGASFQIGCDEDDNDCAVNPFVDGDTFDKAVELWNHRAAHTEGEEIERLRIQVADLSKMEEEYREYLQSRSVAQPDNASQGSTDKGKCGFCGEPAVFGFLYDQFGSRYEGWTCKKHHPLITSGERPEQVEAQPDAWRWRQYLTPLTVHPYWGDWQPQNTEPQFDGNAVVEVQPLYTSPPKVTEEMVERTPDG